jgi:hypothetical protein
MTRILKSLFLAILCLVSSACFDLGSEKPAPRLVLFVGVDVSGSFVNSPSYSDSLKFLSRYLYAHLNGYGDLEVPHSLFVGLIGGKKADEAKTMYPIHVFQDKSIDQIEATLTDIFKNKTENPYTDFNSYFEQVQNTVKNRKLILKPISIVLLSDGKPDSPVKGDKKYKQIDLGPLENLSRDVTVRLLYTDADTGDHWQNQVPRRRVKVWSQDKEVMKRWKESNIIDRKKPFSEQKKFFKWIKDNVDFRVRSKRVS